MPLLGEISALITAALWSGSSFVFAAAIVRVGSVQVNIIRLIIAAMLLAGVVFAMNPETHLSTSQLIYLAVSGIIGLVFGDTFLFQSYVYNGARLSMLIMSVAPAISAVLAFFLLNEVLSLWGIAGMLVTIAGIGLVVSERREDAKHQISKLGLLYGFLGAVGQGAGLIFARLAFDEGEINGFLATLVRIVPSVVILLPAGILMKRFRNPIQVFSRERRALFYTFLGSLLGPCLGITFSLIAVAHTKVGIAATLMSTSPIMMLPLAKFVHREALSWKAMSGAFIAVGGVAILFLR
jgi:drug/metabolite transporter (DMT)-like permease